MSASDKGIETLKQSSISPSSIRIQTWERENLLSKYNELHFIPQLCSPCQEIPRKAHEGIIQLPSEAALSDCLCVDCKSKLHSWQEERRTKTSAELLMRIIPNPELKIIPGTWLFLTDKIVQSEDMDKVWELYYFDGNAITRVLFKELNSSQALKDFFSRINREKFLTYLTIQPHPLVSGLTSLFDHPDYNPIAGVTTYDKTGKQTGNLFAIFKPNKIEYYPNPVYGSRAPKVREDIYRYEFKPLYGRREMPPVIVQGRQTLLRALDQYTKEHSVSASREDTVVQRTSFR
ncbi:MAG: hypothetical protein K2Q33_02155 [Gammaproteobacteria bacterium]|nr:hypothetical protein [Gammaproteobacteria bacterium]